MAEELGVAKLELQVDLSLFEAGLDKARQLIGELNGEVQLNTGAKRRQRKEQAPPPITQVVDIDVNKNSIKGLQEELLRLEQGRIRLNVNTDEFKSATQLAERLKGRIRELQTPTQFGRRRSGGASESIFALERAQNRRFALARRIDDLESKGGDVGRLRTQLGRVTEAQSAREFEAARRLSIELARQIVLAERRTKANREAAAATRKLEERGARQGGPRESVDARFQAQKRRYSLDQQIRSLEAAGVKSDRFRATLGGVTEAQAKSQFGSAKRLSDELSFQLQKERDKLKVQRDQQATFERAARQGGARSPVGGSLNIPGSPAYIQAQIRGQERLKKVEESAFTRLAKLGGASSPVRGRKDIEGSPAAIEAENKEIERQIQLDKRLAEQREKTRRKELARNARQGGASSPISGRLRDGSVIEGSPAFKRLQEKTLARFDANLLKFQKEGFKNLPTKEVQAIARVLEEISRVDASKPFDDLAASAEQATSQLAAAKAELASLLSDLPSPANPVEELGDSGKSAVAELSGGFNALQSEIDQTSSKVERLKKLQDSLRQSGAATPTAAPTQRASSIPEGASRPITTKTSQSRIESAARSLLEWTDGVLPGVENLFGSLEKALDVIRAKGAIFDPDAVPGLDADTARNDRAIGRQTPATEAVSAAYREFYASVEKEAAKPRKVINIDLGDLSGKLAQARQQVRSTLESIAKDRAGAPVGTTAGISPQTLGSVQSTKASIDQVLGAINRVKQQIASIKAVDLTPSGAEELNQFNGILDSIDSQFKTLRGSVEQSGDAISNLQAPVDAASNALGQLDIAPDVQSKIAALTEQIRLLEAAAEGAGAAVNGVGGGATAPPPPPPPPQRPRASLSDLGIARQDALRRQAAAPVGSTANVQATEQLAKIEALITREKQRQEQLNKQLGISGQKKKRISQEELKAERNKKIKDAIGSGLIGGAFPALFGQGLGASVGGAAGGIGGGVLGGQFGFGLSLVGTAVGAQVDALVARITTLGSALKDPVANFQELAQAGLVSSAGLQKNIEALIASGREAEARAQIELDAARQFGDTTAFKELSSASDELNRSFAQLSVQLGGFIAGPLADLLQRISNVAQSQTEANTFVDRGGTTDEINRAISSLQLPRPTPFQQLGDGNAPLNELRGFSPENQVKILKEATKLREKEVGTTLEQEIAQAKANKAAEDTVKVRRNSLQILREEAKGLTRNSLILQRENLNTRESQAIDALGPNPAPAAKQKIRDEFEVERLKIDLELDKRSLNSIFAAQQTLRQLEDQVIAIEITDKGFTELITKTVKARQALDKVEGFKAQAEAEVIVKGIADGTLLNNFKNVQQALALLNQKQAVIEVDSNEFVNVTRQIVKVQDDLDRLGAKKSIITAQLIIEGIDSGAITNSIQNVQRALQELNNVQASVDVDSSDFVRATEDIAGLQARVAEIDGSKALITAEFILRGLEEGTITNSISNVRTALENLNTAQVTLDVDSSEFERLGRQIVAEEQRLQGLEQRQTVIRIKALFEGIDQGSFANSIDNVRKGLEGLSATQLSLDVDSSQFVELGRQIVLREEQLQQLQNRQTIVKISAIIQGLDAGTLQNSFANVQSLVQQLEGLKINLDIRSPALPGVIGQLVLARQRIEELQSASANLELDAIGNALSSGRIAPSLNNLERLIQLYTQLRNQAALGSTAFEKASQKLNQLTDLQRRAAAQQSGEAANNIRQAAKQLQDARKNADSIKPEIQKVDNEIKSVKGRFAIELSADEAGKKLAAASGKLQDALRQGADQVKERLKSAGDSLKSSLQGAFKFLTSSQQSKLLDEARNAIGKASSAGFIDRAKASRIRDPQELLSLADAAKSILEASQNFRDASEAAISGPRGIRTDSDAAKEFQKALAAASRASQIEAETPRSPTKVARESASGIGDVVGLSEKRNELLRQESEALKNTNSAQANFNQVAFNNRPLGRSELQQVENQRKQANFDLQTQSAKKNNEPNFEALNKSIGVLTQSTNNLGTKFESAAKTIADNTSAVNALVRKNWEVKVQVNAANGATTVQTLNSLS